MKKWIKAVALSLALILVIPVSVPQCDQTVVQAATKKPKLNVKNNKKTLKVGDTFKIKVTNYRDKFKWTSSNKKVATVDKNGVIKAKKAGITTISTTKDQYWIYCTVVVKSAFDADEAKEKITFAQVTLDNTVYKVTSTYGIPTYVTANYKIVDKDGVTISKSSTGVLATPWGDSYIKIPSGSDGQTVQLSYSYSDRSFISKDKYDNLLNSIQISKFENISGNSFWGHGDIGSFMYDVYLKNTSNKKISGNIGFLIYDDNGVLLPYQANSQTNINLDPDETVKQSIEVLQEIKDIDHPFDGMTNVGDIKFYIAGL